MDRTDHESPRPRLPSKNSDWMGLHGFNMRNPRRVAVEQGERACLDCLRGRGAETRHDQHHPRPVPERMPSLWLVAESTRWDAIPEGTHLCLDAFSAWHFDGDGGSNASWEGEFLFSATDGPLAGEIFRVSTSGPDDDTWGQSLFPTFLTPVAS